MRNISFGGLGQLVSSACSIAGPMLGALLMSITTLQVAMLVDVIGATLAVFTLSLIKISKPDAANGEKIYVIADMKLGLAAMLGGLVSSNLFWVFCVCVFIIGASAMRFNIPFNAYIQKSMPEENLGKVMSLMTSVLSFAAPVGMFTSGPIAQIIGVSNWMIGAGILVIISGALSYFLTHKYDIKENTN